MLKPSPCIPIPKRTDSTARVCPKTWVDSSRSLGGLEGEGLRIAGSVHGLRSGEFEGGAERLFLHATVLSFGFFAAGRLHVSAGGYRRYLPAPPRLPTMTAQVRASGLTPAVPAVSGDGHFRTQVYVLHGIEKLDDLLRIEVVRVGGEGGSGRVLHALVHRENGEVARAPEAAGIEHGLQVPQDPSRPVGRRYDALDEVPTREMEPLPGNSPALVGEKLLVGPEEVLDPVNHASVLC